METLEAVQAVQTVPLWALIYFTGIVASIIVCAIIYVCGCNFCVWEKSEVEHAVDAIFAGIGFGIIWPFVVIAGMFWFLGKLLALARKVVLNNKSSAPPTGTAIALDNP